MKTNKKTKWSKYDERIKEAYDQNPSASYSYVSRELLGDEASHKQIEAFRRYIQRFIKKESSPNIVTETMNRYNMRGNDWSIAWIKEKGISLKVNNRREDDSKSLEEIREEFIQDMDKYAPKYEKFEYSASKDPHCLIIDIADLHIGKLATMMESKNEYNTQKALSHARDGVAGILSKSSGFDLDKIIFIIGNDVLHIDTTKRTTTSGTPQDTSGMWYDNFVLARKLYCSVIESLCLIAPVHVIHCPSNHDFMSGFMLADSIHSWFRNNPNVTFDVSMSHRKYYQYGDSLISVSHGDGAKIDKIPYLAAHEVPQMWSDTKYRYAYLHHIHHKDLFKFQSGKDFIGMTVEYMRSPSGTDSWHHRQGYTGVPKAIEAVVHSKDKGQVARITHIFN